MTEEQLRALRKLKQGITHADGYGPPISDDSALFMTDENAETLYELATAEGQLTLGHLRDIASLLGDE